MSGVHTPIPSVRPTMAMVICALIAPLAAGHQLPAAVVGLDHVTIGVNDLERAAAQYRRLGFSLKPGRPHANGIRNEHAKFPDGTELELITAPEERDALTGAYRRHLASGDGPAFLALFVPDRRRTPPKPKVPLDYLFFGSRNASPTDRPEHFAHPNTAESLIAVWVAADDTRLERRLFESYGATIARRDVHVPDPASASVVRFPEGEVVLLPGSRQRIDGRRLVGVTLRVRNVEQAAAILARERIAVERSSSTPSLFVPPASAHGLWIELRPADTGQLPTPNFQLPTPKPPTPRSQVPRPKSQAEVRSTWNLDLGSWQLGIDECRSPAPTRDYPAAPRLRREETDT